MVSALREQNIQVASGVIGQPPAPAGTSFQLPVTTLGRLLTPEQFGDVVIKTGADGRITRMRDLGRVELGARDYSVNSYLNGEPAVAMAVAQRPGSNALATSDAPDLARGGEFCWHDALWRELPPDLWERFTHTVGSLHAVFLVFRFIAALTLDLPPDLLHGGPFIGIGILEPILVMFAATIIGLRLSDERLKNILKRAALTDGLTGLLNHGAFMDLARERVERARDQNELITLLLFDLDRFKQLNDRYGHAAGDEALKFFSTIVQRCVSEADFVGRVGGEEFAALLIGCGAERGRQVAERIRTEFAGDPIRHAGHRITVTVSVGVMTVCGQRADFESLMVAADEALYAAKRGGRDLVFQAAS